MMAIGASIHCNHLEGTKPRSNDIVSVYPIPYYFESYPAIADLVESSVNYGLATLKKKTQNLFLFVPLAVSSFDSGTQNDTSEPLLHTDHFIRLHNLCASYEASGIMSTVRQMTHSFMDASPTQNVFPRHSFFTGKFICNPV